MKKLTTIVLVGLISASAAFAQQITFRAEIGSVFLRGAAQDRLTAVDSNLAGIGFFVPAAQFSTFTASDVWTRAAPTITLEELSSILELVIAQPGFASAMDVARLAPDSPAPPPAGVLNQNINPGGPGFHPVFIIHDSPTGPAGLGLGSNIAIVASSFASPNAGTVPIGFNTTNKWDQFLVGPQGSVQLATVIPEPSTYAALFGIFALAGVMIRRRLRK